MTQRYLTPAAHERMAAGTCPECGYRAEEHSDDPRFWTPRGASGCSLLPRGVTERIEAYLRDRDMTPEERAAARAREREELRKGYGS
ncbi:Uncharacterised protein (plasmid) [Tsukamurella tyrosinosolvens]|uniref:Uncharacterized protein n=1 Tax=Tsukamurella tyrosinosolvens TaxID=57704 RepID=A0A1H4VJH0_TSUTY|nr:hypothetical protein AXK58_21230 [Tsukamurella tyrosinosolvens]SEC81136.1 hypothetical protein SAMN04489793_3248 [Tsukamurella tyrosinosolvens]VEH90477.1 Uncharacterised protein [Tsukamurella tyrosinosolvens]